MAGAIKDLARSVLGRRTRRSLRFDLLRLKARLRQRSNLAPPTRLLHLGCGFRRVEGFLNVDVAGSEHDVDLAGGRLPWRDGSFEAVVSQQVIEHLEVETELLPLLRELSRMLVGGGEAWLACPDMERVCRSYLDDGGQELLSDRRRRWPDFALKLPAQQMVNVLFHQAGEHLNLFDLPLLRWLLLEAGFSNVERVTEDDLLSRFPGFPRRDDDQFSLYVKATR